MYQRRLQGLTPNGY